MNFAFALKNLLPVSEVIYKEEIQEPKFNLYLKIDS